MSPRIPVTVIGGFLGSGKTTLLNQLLRAEHGERVALLINDFGAINIDAALVSSRDADTVALTNGCVCCSIGDDLTQALIKVIEAKSPYDRVFIEASGVSDPKKIAQLVSAAPELQLELVVVMIDATSILKLLRDARIIDTILSQLHAADLAVINKTDLVNLEELLQVHRRLESELSKIPVFETSHSMVPWSMISKNIQASTSHELSYAQQYEPAKSDPKNSIDHTQIFDTWSGMTLAVKSIDQWKNELDELTRDLLRLKGVVRSKEHGWSEIQAVGRRIEISPAFAAPKSKIGSIAAISAKGKLPREGLQCFCKER